MSLLLGYYLQENPTSCKVSPKTISSPLIKQFGGNKQLLPNNDLQKNNSIEDEI